MKIVPGDAMTKKHVPATKGPIVTRYLLKKNRPPQESDFLEPVADSTPKKETKKKTPQKANRTSVVKSKPTDIPLGVQNRALSIRQPYVEQIMRGTKVVEYRGMLTHIRGRVYVYASLTPGPQDEFRFMQAQPGDFPTGLILGTVEIIDCTGVPGDYEWHLARPIRLDVPIKPENHPQPSWFIPFNK
jgi:hypothetical protein